MWFIADCIKGRKAYTPYKYHPSIQRLFKTGAPQGGLLSLTLFNIYTADLPPPRELVQGMVYPDTYSHTYIKHLPGQNITISQCTLPVAIHPDVLGLTLDPKLTCKTHIYGIFVHTHKFLQIITSIWWLLAFLTSINKLFVQAIFYVSMAVCISCLHLCLCV